MNNTLNKVLIFVAGAAVGSFATWKLVKTKYEKIADEEIKSVKEKFGMFTTPSDIEESEEEGTVFHEEEVFTVEDLKAAEDIALKNGYTNYSGSPANESKKMEDVERPYVISPDDYGELYDYDTIELTYYADGILADNSDNPVDDIEDVVGYASLGRIGEYENDIIHVRNDRYSCDYEIVLDTRTYTDVAGNGPRRTED